MLSEHPLSCNLYVFAFRVVSKGKINSMLQATFHLVVLISIRQFSFDDNKTNLKFRRQLVKVTILS